MDSCARGAFLSGVGFLASHNWLQAARVSNSAVATKRISVDSRGAYSASMCIDIGTRLMAIWRGRSHRTR